ncbi:MAG: hypothetical protein ACOYKN_20570, partial [Pirellula sp.]
FSRPVARATACDDRRTSQEDSTTDIAMSESGGMNVNRLTPSRANRDRRLSGLCADALADDRGLCSRRRCKHATSRYVYASYIDGTLVRKRAGTRGTWNW